MTKDEEHFVKHLLEEIDFATDQKRWDAVEDLAERIRKIDPDNPDALALSRTAIRRRGTSPRSSTSPSDADVAGQIHPKELSLDSFIGRDEELAHLRRTLDRVVAEHGQMDMLVGEPGVGKSRLSEELSAYARETGVRVLSGRCYEEGGAPPYWPWAQAVRAYLAETHVDELSGVLGPRAPLVATIFPEIRERIADLDAFDPGRQDPETVRFRLFDAVASFLVDISNTSPTLIVLDDLHWADESSLKLLVFLARELERSHLYVLGTYRDVDLDRRHLLSDALGELTRERLFGRHPLKGFDLPEVRSYIHAVSGTAPPERLARTVCELTNGNPLFVSQMTRLVAQDEEYQSYYQEGIPEEEIRLPEGVREVIGRRLNHLSKECNEVLAVAAVLGLEFRLRALILTIGGDTEDTVLNALDEAERVHFIERVHNTSGVYVFTHALVRQTLLNELSLSKSVRLHAQITEALEGLYGENIAAHAEELAEHAQQAETVLGPERLVRYSLLAGEQALDRHADEDALLHYERGLAAFEDSPLDAQKAALLYGMGTAQMNMLMYVEARESYRRAMDHYEKTGDVEHVTSIAVASQFHGHDTALCERALKVLPEGSLAAGEVLCRYGYRLMASGMNRDLGREYFQSALHIADRSSDPYLEVTIHSLWARASWFHLRVNDCLEHSLQAIELSKGLQDRSHEIGARGALVDVFKVQGKINDAHQQAKTMERLARESGDRQHMMMFHHARGSLASMEGDWATARRHSDAILSRFAWFMTLNGRAYIEYETGNAALGRQFLDRYLDVVRRNPRVSSMAYSHWALLVARISRISGGTGDLELAEEWGRKGLESPVQTPNGEKIARVALGLLALQRHDSAAAEDQFGILIDEADSTRDGVSLYCQYGPFGEFFGLYLRSVGRLDEAVDHLAKTVAVNQHSRPRIAWLNYELADVLLERLQKGDIEEAKGLLEKALEMAVSLGMPPLEARVRESLVKVSPTAADAYPDNLTQREIEVIYQLVVGKTDQQIADTLFISIKTVSNHVSNILRKTETANRTEAANYATKHGLVEV
jgi:DNA-binding CsgD family transcriptional regulator/tetratricopeptide (TPR) repeat protein